MSKNFDDKLYGILCNFSHRRKCYKQIYNYKNVESKLKYKCSRFNRCKE